MSLLSLKYILTSSYAFSNINPLSLPPVPFMFNSELGLVVPIPTSPSVLITMASFSFNLLPVAKTRLEFVESLPIEFVLSFVSSKNSIVGSESLNEILTLPVPLKFL